MDEATARQRFQVAIDHLAENERDEAREVLNDILDARPDYVEARLALGVLLGGEGVKTEARRHLRFAMEHLRADPKLGSDALRAQVLVNLCALALEEEDWEEVFAWEAEFEDVHDALHRQGLLGQGASTLFKAANSAVQERRIDAGRTLYERALMLEPTFAEAWYNLAVLASEDGELDDAIEALRRAITSEPTFADAHFLLGTLLLPNAPEDAVGYMMEAVNLSPENARWITLLGSAFARQRNFHRARELFARSLELDDAQADAHLGFALASRAVGEEEVAKRALQKAFELNPDLAAHVQRMMANASNRG